MIVNKKEYNDINDNIKKIVLLDPIKVYLDEIKESYYNLYQYFLNECIFPKDISTKIIEMYEIINNKIKSKDHTNIKQEFDSLSQQIFEFSEKIKKSSYENNIFDKIKESNNKLIEFKEAIEKDIINNSQIGNITPPINLY